MESITKLRGIKEGETGVDDLEKNFHEVEGKSITQRSRSKRLSTHIHMDKKRVRES